MPSEPPGMAIRLICIKDSLAAPHLLQAPLNVRKFHSRRYSNL
ncbi:hypothetical protein KL86PLE_41332 [uncultured Pleomorphomonas sp.]|uniref:Uncharacterized protein n=1 Tax=uncultured Pleomorphomonas sp. TaxID=442121 RepID=A0A212LJ68_9HYPH|nr:hypothetical protein KL86PLE_41332 [uncultured Pleomorphomonas sp.]